MLETFPRLVVQVTAVFVFPLTMAVNCCVPPEAMVAVVGEMLTETVGVVLTKNSSICGAVAAAPGKLVKPSAAIIIRRVL